MPTLLQPGTVRLEEQLAILEALQKEVMPDMCLRYATQPGTGT